jgi:hypothetical protein
LAASTQQVVPHPGETLPPSHPGVPDRTLRERVLDVIIAYWHLGHGQVTDPTGIPEAELIKGMTVRDLLATELAANARFLFGQDAQVQIFDNGFERVGIAVIDAKGQVHRAQAVAEREGDNPKGSNPKGAVLFTDISWNS